MNFKVRLYQKLFRILLKKVRKARENHPVVHAEVQGVSPSSKKQRSRIWFHAASAGELESLWPVILHEAETFELIITVFSVSGLKPLTRLCDELRKMSSAQLLWAGLSPVEGEWESFFRLWKPKAWVTAKYEAWPEVWAVLATAQIPLVVIGAQNRFSLRLARFFTRWIFGLELPWILFFTPNDQEKKSLGQEFPAARLESLSDPRWKRVYVRAIQKNPRAEFLLQYLSSLPRPWGILGSAWLEDLEVWENLNPSLLKGTLWIVPHQIHEDQLMAATRWAESAGHSVVCTAAVQGTVGTVQKNSWVIVNEVGFLAELYQHMDWAYVGGGFAQGVHSTIEPAIWGIPLACGVKKSERFAEIAELRETHQLTLVRSSDELASWLREVLQGDRKSQQIQWKQDAERRMQAVETGISILHEQLQMLN